MIKKEETKKMTETINFRMEKLADDFLNVLSNKNKNSEFNKSSVTRDLVYWSMMWVLECFPSIRNGEVDNIEQVLKQIRREGKDSFSLRVKIQNVIHQTTERRKE